MPKINSKRRAIGLKTRALTPKRLERYLDEVEKCGAITQAARNLKLSRKKLSIYRNDHPEYNAKVLMALEAYTERLALEADRRGVEGVDEDVYYEGEVVGQRKKYSDSLLMFRLKGLDARYRDGPQVAVHSGGSVNVYIPDNNRK